MTKALLITFFLLSCSLLYSCNDEQKSSELYSYPDWKEDSLYSTQGKDIFIFLTGGLNSNLYPHTELKEANLPKELPNALKVGGTSILKSYLRVISKRFKNKAIILSDGNLDLYHEDKKMKSSLKEILPELAFDSILLGPRDLLPLNHQSYAFDHMKKMNWLSSNILAIKAGKPTQQWNSRPFLLLEKNKLKIGIIGISSYELLGPKEKDHLTGFYFQDPVVSILRTKNELKKEGADIIILYHQGPRNCQRPKNIGFPFSFSRLPSDIKCDKGFEPKEIIERLPPGTLDLIIGSFDGAASFIHKGTPIIGQFNNRKFLTAIRINIKEKSIDFPDSYFLEPLKLCHLTFAGTKDCILSTGNEEIDEKRFDILGRSSFHLLPAKFFGYEIQEDSEILKILSDK